MNEEESKEYQNKMAKVVGERNEIEVTFGTGRAKLPDIANSWTALCYFVKNVMKFLLKLLCVLFFHDEYISKSIQNCGESYSFA